jgi:hypothetical protein
MPCERYVSPDGSFTAIICSRGRRKVEPCAYCGKPFTSLCDFPTEGGGTCDRKMCNDCRTTIGNDLDVCPRHNNPRDIAITKMGR